MSQAVGRGGEEGKEVSHEVKVFDLHFQENEPVELNIPEKKRIIFPYVFN